MSVFHMQEAEVTMIFSDIYYLYHASKAYKRISVSEHISPIIIMQPAYDYESRLQLSKICQMRRRFRQISFNMKAINQLEERNLYFYVLYSHTIQNIIYYFIIFHLQIIIYNNIIFIKIFSIIPPLHIAAMQNRCIHIKSRCCFLLVELLARYFQKQYV